MRYFKYESEEYTGIAGAVDYFEVDETDGTALRQLTQGTDEIVISNRRHPHWGLALADKAIDCDEAVQIEGVTEIAAAAFETVWQQELARFADQWQRTKEHYPIGMTIEGRIAIFYPQGVIVELDETALGCVRWEQFSPTSSRPHSTQVLLTATISSYDEQQQWVLLERPRF